MPRDSEVDRRAGVTSAARADLACEGTAVVAVMDRRYLNGTSLRYVVEGCGKRALYLENCEEGDVCRYLMVSLVAIGAKGAMPGADPVPKPVSIFSATETSAEKDTVEEVVYRDAQSAQHRMELHYTSYPIAPRSVTVDGHDLPRGPAWAALGRALAQAGLDNNATLLLRCFGGDETARC